MARTAKRQSRSKLDDIAKAEKAALAARLRASGRSLEQIAAELGVSRATAYRLVGAGSRAYLRQSQQPVPAWVNKAIADLLKAAQENWTQWERSKQDRYQKKTINKPDGTVEVQEIVEPQCAERGYLAEFRKCMETIAKLRGAYAKHGEIKSPLSKQEEAEQQRTIWSRQFHEIQATTRPPRPAEKPGEVSSHL